MNIERFSVIEQKLGIRRTTVLGVTLWMTWRVTAWGMTFADHVIAVKGDGLGSAALVGAVTAPVAYMLKAVFDGYNQAKKGPA